MSGNPDNLLSPGDFVAPDLANPSYASVLGSQVATRAAANLLWRGAKGVAGDAWDLIKRPGQILEGSAVPAGSPWANRLGTPEVNPTEYATGLAGYGMGVGSLFAPPVGSLGMFAGKRAGTADMEKLAEAEQMEKMGTGGFLQKLTGRTPNPATPDQIYDRTGWFRGADKEWRHVIPDEGMRVKTENMHEMGTDASGDMYYRVARDARPLSNFLEHDDLFDAYPWAKDIKVRKLDQFDADMGIRGQFDPDRNVMFLGPNTTEGHMQTIVHELQHAVQLHEGFTTGGSYREFLPLVHDAQEMANNQLLANMEGQIQGHGIDPQLVAGHFGFGDPIHVGQYGAEVSQLPHDLVTGYLGQRTRQIELNNRVFDAMQRYSNLAGEVEARTTEAQLLQRRWTAPWRSGTVDPGYGTTILPYTPFSQQEVR